MITTIVTALLAIAAVWYYDRKLNQTIKEIRHMSTVLAALQQADSELANAVNTTIADSKALLAEVATLTGQLANTVDPTQVQAVTADISAKVALLQSNNAALEAALAQPSNPAPPVAP